MADSKITAFSALTGANLASGDKFELVDVSDTTMDATGTNKNITVAELILGLRALGMVDIQTFAASGTWNKPTSCTAVQVVLVSGGGGGGSGRVETVTTAAFGGGGGGGGAFASKLFA